MVLENIHTQSIKCDYDESFFYQIGYLKYNESFYACFLYTRQSSFNVDPRVITGEHLFGRTDLDVDYVRILDNNSLRRLSSIFCEKFKNLLGIKLTGSQLEVIDENSLRNCRNLQDISIDNNRILQVPEYLLIQNLKLRYFLLRNNDLQTLPENFFINQKELISLNLEGNRITYLPGNIFLSLERLVELDMRNNRLRVLNPAWFANLVNLEYLSLIKNQLKEIPAGIFRPLRNLREFFIYENSIQILNSYSFDGLDSLKILNIRSNGISQLPAAVFAPLKNLEILYIQDNKLSTLHSISFGYHYFLKEIYLYDNKLRSIDERIIDNSDVNLLDMKGNICSNSILYSKADIKQNLRTCFRNYNPRVLPATQSIPRPNLSQSQVPANLQTSAINCGRTTIVQGNIIGGTQIIHGAFPWIAALITLQNKYFCGGILISDRKVITAAHCLRDKRSYTEIKADQFFVLLGSYDLNKSNEIGRAYFAVQSTNIHPNWNAFAETFDADIAVLVLADAVTYTKYIQPICVTAANSIVTRISSGVVVGYGKSQDQTKVHENIPKIINMPIQRNEDCFLKNHVLARFSSQRTFCAGTGNGIGVCNGDSGGGLIVNYNGIFYLRGIVSASLFNLDRSCDVNTFSIFTDALNFIDWIVGIPTALPFSYKP